MYEEKVSYHGTSRKDPRYNCVSGGTSCYNDKRKQFTRLYFQKPEYISKYPNKCLLPYENELGRRVALSNAIKLLSFRERLKQRGYKAPYINTDTDLKPEKKTRDR